jgi:poly-gamma-glutamate biosynthesis protein PgsC/CapC
MIVGELHAYPFDVHTVRLAVVLGLVVGMLFYERLHLTTGGAIVPGYLALFTPMPLFIIATTITALLTYFLVNRVIGKRWIIYGRLKFEIEILTGLVLTALWMLLAYFLAGIDLRLGGLLSIGFLIPAIIAHDMGRQTPRKTLAAVGVTTGIVATMVYVIHSLRQITPGAEFADVPPLDAERFAYPFDLLLFGIFFSVLAGMFIFRRAGLRTGGFVTGGYLGLFVFDWREIAFVAVIAAATYLVVTQLLMRVMLIFGRRKLGVMSLTAAILAWSAETALGWITGGAYVPWSGFHVITLIVPALLANDAERQGPYHTAWGAALTTAAVFAAMNFVAAARLYFG